MRLFQLIIVVFVGLWSAGQAWALGHQDITINWQPSELMVKAVLRADRDAPQWYLRADLEPSWLGGAPVSMATTAEGLTRYQFEQTDEPLVVHYSIPFSKLGVKNNSVRPLTVLLSSAEGLLPQTEALYSFNLSLHLPRDISSVSQGVRKQQDATSRRHTESWQENAPQDELHVVLGSFHEFNRKHDGKTYSAFLLQNDKVLADRYLNQTHEFVKMYEHLIGPYPYGKFSLVENMEQTGYGMPSFTLLGSKVIRLPFILFSSYPHEVLHNWWGNSVYVDYREGNWSEGLTTYLADYLLKEQRGQGAEYRRSVLQKYRDYVTPENDFPLATFKGRFDKPSEAVGYGKTMMLFHMLRLRMGDKAFIAALRDLYKQQKFRKTGYSEIKEAFTRSGNLWVDRMFAQWLDRKGAPELALTDIKQTRVGRQYVFSFTLSQVQAGTLYDLDVPVFIQTRKGAEAERHLIRLNEKSRTVKLIVPASVRKVAVDPLYDVFRRLNVDETPPSIGQLYAQDKAVFVLPRSLAAEQRAMYRKMISIWQAYYKDVSVVSTLPADTTDVAVWYLGQAPARSARHWTYAENAQAIFIKQSKTEVLKANQSVVAVSRHNGMTQGWVRIHGEEAIAGLVRKLPHYGKYGVLVFEGKDPRNMVKQAWPVVSKTLSWAAKGVGNNWRFPQQAPLYKRD